MLNIQPRTYQEAITLARSLLVRKYAPDLSDEQLEKIYHFISSSPQHRVYISNNILKFSDRPGHFPETFPVENTIEGFQNLHLSAASLSVFGNFPRASSDAGGGVSGNNNNNNNNNNNG